MITFGILCVNLVLCLAACALMHKAHQPEAQFFLGLTGLLDAVTLYLFTRIFKMKD